MSRSHDAPDEIDRCYILDAWSAVCIIDVEGSTKPRTEKHPRQRHALTTAVWHWYTILLFPIVLRGTLRFPGASWVTQHWDFYAFVFTDTQHINTVYIVVVRVSWVLLLLPTITWNLIELLSSVKYRYHKSIPLLPEFTQNVVEISGACIIKWTMNVITFSCKSWKSNFIVEVTLV